MLVQVKLALPDCYLIVVGEFLLIITHVSSVLAVEKILLTATNAKGVEGFLMSFVSRLWFYLGL